MTRCPLHDISNTAFSPFMADEEVFGAIENPWPIMAEHRRAAPVSPGSYSAAFGAPSDPAAAGRPQYTAWTYDTVREVLDDPVLFSSTIIHKLGVEKAFGRILIVMDPPEHGQARRFLQQAFSPGAARQWNDRVIRPVINELIDAFADRGSAELVSEFTRRFPFDIVCRLLDLPPKDVDLFQKLAVTQTFAITPYVDEAMEAGGNLAEYFRCLVDQRRRNPGTDLISQLIATEIDGEVLEEEVLIAFLRHILNAGADTSFRTTGCLLVALLSDPSALAELSADRNMVSIAIEEALRWEGPVASNFRTLTRDHTLGGVELAAGTVIYVAQGSANRDETYFSDPDRFDLHRPRNVRHFGFGGGPHICVGMHLARLQIREAIAALLDRLPGLRIDPAFAPPVIKGFHFRAPPELRVLF